MVVKRWWWCLLVHVCFHFVRFTLSTTILSDRLEMKAVMVSRYMNLFCISNWIIKPHFCHWSLLTCSLLVTRNKYDFLHWLNLKPQSLLAILLSYLSLFVFFFSFLCHVTFSSVIHHCWFDVSMGIQPITKKPVPTHFPKVLFLNSGGRNLNLSLFLRSMLFLGVAVTTVNASVLKRLPSSMCRKDRWSQIWFSGSEPRVVGFSWRSFTVWNLNRNLITWIYLDSGSYSGDMIFVGILLECWKACSVWRC